MQRFWDWLTRKPKPTPPPRIVEDPLVYMPPERWDAIFNQWGR